MPQASESDRQRAIQKWGDIDLVERGGIEEIET